MRQRLHLTVGAMLGLSIAGLLDWATLGAPSASIWRYVFADIAGVAAHADREPWYYYGLAEAAIWGAALPIPIALWLWGARMWRLPVLMTLGLVAAHMAIGHKEHRYLFPALVLGAIQAGIGMADIAARLGRRLEARGATASPMRTASLGCALAWAAVSAAVWCGPGLSTLRARARDTLAAADYAAGLPGLCGIGMGPGRNAWVPYGGYTHLHQSVPLFWPANQAAFDRESAGFNLLLSATREPGYTPLRCFGDACVAERQGGCVPTPPDPMPGPVGSEP
jgi:hypothetical protein